VTAHSTPPLAYSYIRFSTPEQAKGDSLRRQTEAAAAWCKRNGVRLDTSLTLHDLGKSAFRGQHHKDDKHALGAFIRLAESGRVPEGSYLIIERLDRLTREDVNDALELFLRLKKLVRIVQLSPVEVTHDRHSNPMQLMMALVELMRGRDESQAKSERNGAAWVVKRDAARAGADQPPRKKDGRVTKAMTGRLPAWVEDRGGRLRLIPGRAAAVRRVFELAAAGYGQALIIRRLNGEGVRPFDGPGCSGTWLRAYVAKLLRDRRVVGELVPCSRGGKAGPPIAGYYPAAVGEELWQAARIAVTGRDSRPGGRRTRKHVHLFSGLLSDARDGGSMYCHGRGGKTFVINAAGLEGHKRAVTFPLDVLERGLLSCLREVDAADVLGKDDGPDEVMALSGELAGLEARIGELEAELLGEGEVPAIARALRALEARRKDRAARLADARQKAASPLSEAWGEAKGLLGALDAAPDQADARLRLRAALRRVVEGVQLLIVPRGRGRLCAAQVCFGGGGCRDYLVHYEPPQGNAAAKKPGGWRARALKEVGVPEGAVDLRKRSHAKAMERELESFDLSKMD
jgi:DNA invertase Pin-like site-specific DNA recombinase